MSSLDESWENAGLTHEELLDGVEAEFLLLEPDLVRFRCEPRRKRSYRVSERSGEEDDLRVLSRFCDETVRAASVGCTSVGKDREVLLDLDRLVPHRPRFEHVVCLVEDKHLDVF